MSVITFYTNKPQGGVFKYSAGTVVIGEKGIQIDPPGVIRGGVLNIFSRTPGSIRGGWGYLSSNNFP